MLRRFLAPFAALPLLAACATLPSQATSPVVPLAGNVSAADPRAEEAGLAMLRQGGNATDAAIATMIALTVVEPQSSGIGGGGFLVRGTADGTVASYDGREKAPAGAFPGWFLDEAGKVPSFDASVKSGLSVGVPGNIAMAAKAHAEHGKLPWPELFEPAIALARDGFRMNPRLVQSLTNTADRAGWTAGGRALFFGADGKPLPAGTLVKNEELAKTFEAIAKAGPAAFYSGPRAEELARTVAAATPRPQPMSVSDLAAYDAKQRPAVCGDYRGYRLCGMGPPSSGGIAVLQILEMLERFDLKALGKDNPVTWHLFLEAQRLAYADRELYAADSDFVAVPVAGLIDPAYLAARSAMIDPAKTIENPRAGTPKGAKTALADGDEPEEHGTSHFAATDASGTMVSYTSTIESAFGSGLMTGGFYLNNELTDFSRAPEVNGVPVANRVEGGKRPRSSMAPMVVWDPAGKPFLVVGAAGGGTIPVSTTRAIIGMIDFGLDAETALGLPFVMAFGPTILVEKGTWAEAAIPQFEALGHTKFMAREAPIKVNALLRTPAGWQRAREPRMDSLIEAP
ncbi:Gamma-glutamyltranspeptidase precursor [Tsuneonella dongtanensis]|uniref:Glutathione hydrolase proenzyme n=1 Tax=Tsuneonella dongtanensis TaxID=692370 RepID=A0A1B2AAD1_9SPHN|nr:gamma-glutamyltransferase [Tsuneonella dongtanensis]ANY19054.1 Gamma-glutamyltranspeptidase precursor [Tsuneonella dongtanensis]